MAVKRKAGPIEGGSWSGAALDGRLKVKSGAIGGGSWRTPAYCKVKANGVWVDSGYRGYPGNPSAPWVYNWSSWGYTHMQIAWSYASGGAPAVSYDALQQDSAGNWLNAEWGGTDNLTGFNVAENGYYQYLVRSVGATGLVSPWQGPLRVYMGHAATPNYGWVHHADYWYQQIDGYWGKDQPAWIYVPNSVQISAFHFSLSTPMSSVLSPGTNRQLYHVFLSNQYGEVISFPSPVYHIEYFPNFAGGNAYWGFVPRGAGWSTTGNSYYSVNGAFGVEGYNHYDVNEIVSWNPATGNGYW